MTHSKKQSGVDLDLQDKCSRTAFGWAKRTFANRRGRLGAPVMEVDGSFANLADFGEIKVAISSDGIGTKVELAERTGVYDTLGFDLTAMVADDLAANGFEPVNLSNVLDVDHLDLEIVDSLMKGLHDAAAVSRVAVTGGEIAELGARIGGWGGGMHFNWCATAVGVLPPGSTPIDGSLVAPGQRILALRSRGFRSNGFSLARRTLENALGAGWHDVRYEDGRTWGELLLTPSLIYAPLVADLIARGCPPTGVVHVTGGGVPGNLQRVLSIRSLGARLDDLHQPHGFITALAELGGVEPKTAYSMWNMGNGMLLIAPEERVKTILAAAAEAGYEARDAGVVTDHEGLAIHTPSPWDATLEFGRTDR